MVKTEALGQLAKVVRSKNAGPFRFTFDIFFDDRDKYELVKQSGVINAETISKLYRIHEDKILGIYFVDEALGIKITVLRHASSGSPEDTDVYGAQQHAPLLGLEIPTSQF